MDAPTQYPCVIFLESDSADNDDWITDHSGDPQSITFTNYTEGTECVVLYNPKRYQCLGDGGNKATPIAGGNTYEERTGNRAYSFSITGHCTSLTQENYFNTFFMLERHTEKNSWKSIYMVYKEASDTYKKFVDEDGSLQEYCKCNAKATVLWESRMGLKRVIEIKGVSTW